MQMPSALTLNFMWNEPFRFPTLVIGPWLVICLICVHVSLNVPREHNHNIRFSCEWLFGSHHVRHQGQGARKKGSRYVDFAHPTRRYGLVGSRNAAADLEAKGQNSRVVVGIAGVPGSGKTTLAAAVSEAVNTISCRQDLAVAIPMDGFHYTRAHLGAMDDPETAIHCRGAAYTFDGEAFLSLIRDLTSSEPRTTVYAPSFSHEIKDPVERSIPIPASARIVLVEGNYCALDRKPWSDAASLMTRLWYVDCPAVVAHKRLSKRHLKSGIVRDEREAWERATGTDELNARDIRDNLLEVDETVSVPG